MEGQLFGVAAMNLSVLAGVAGILLLVAMIASVIPSWRASRISPVVVLGS